MRIADHRRLALVLLAAFTCSFLLAAAAPPQIRFRLDSDTTGEVVARADRDAAAWKSRAVYQILTDRFARTGDRAAWSAANGTKTPRCTDLKAYCGGTFRGIAENLDFIEELGFNAIWISPIPENTADGYHGYWARDLYSVNGRYGTVEDLKLLVRECHRRDIWVMLDVVANHMGNMAGVQDTDYSHFQPFNRAEYYHRYCLIRDYENQREVEECRIGGQRSSLADLNTEHPFVIEELYRWVYWIVDEFDLDAVRVDTVKHVRKDFWPGFSKAAGVFAIGEVLHGDPRYVGDYQKYMDSLLNFPMYFTLRDVFQHRQSMWNLDQRVVQNRKHFEDTTVLGNFLDNHDVERFMSVQGDETLLRNAIAYVMMAEGIPFIYYGTALKFRGGNDPQNRESAWPELFDPAQRRTKTSMLLRQLNKLRKLGGPALTGVQQRTISTDDEVHMFERGGALVVLTNVGHKGSLERMLHLPRKMDYVNVLNTAMEERLKFKHDSRSGQWFAHIAVEHGEPKVFWPKELLPASWWQPS